MSDTDLQLLSRYNRLQAEDAFAELVRRHVDLVHSAALRQVRSPQLAEEVAQSVFIDLARQSRRLAPETILSAWLYEVTRRTAIDVVRREARRQLREQIATEMNARKATAANWTHIEPLLDEAMHALDETDRAAVLLRYFENKSLREVGAALGTSDDAAQKRVSRAVERLREFFAKRGLSVGASGLAVVISANAIQMAPAGLTVSISSSVLGMFSNSHTVTATANGCNPMNLAQRILVIVIVVVGAAIPFAIQHQVGGRAQYREEDQRKRSNQQSAELQSPTLSAVPIPESGSPEYWKMLHQMAAGKTKDAFILSTALTQYVSKQRGQFPSSFDQVASFLHELPALTGTNDFEIVYTGSIDELKKIKSMSVAIIRDRHIWRGPAGKRARVYGMIGGFGEIAEADDNFQTWEERHVVASPRNDE